MPPGFGPDASLSPKVTGLVVGLYNPPYKIVSRGGQFCVIKELTGETVKCHDNEADAKAHLRALHANVEDASMEGFFTSYGVLPGAPYHLELFGNDGDIARRALNGEPVLIIPQETFYDHWGQVRDVTPATVSEFKENWLYRMERGIRRQHVAVDEGHEGGAVGWYKEVVDWPGMGVAASFRWTGRGQQILQNGEYAYFSPTVYWRIRDRITGDVVENQIAGGALTNYPYFGESTALMDQKGGPRGITPGISSHKGGVPMTGQDPNLQTGGDEAQAAQRGLMRFFSFLGGSASTSSPSQPANGNGTPVGVSLPADLVTLREQMSEMSTRLGTLETDLATVTQERDTAQQTVAELQNRLGTVENTREAERFANLVRSKFSHLPGEIAQLAQHIMGLYQSEQPNDEGQRPRYEFFMTLLERADEAFSSSFNSIGSRAGATGDALTQINGAIAKYQKEHEGVDYEEAAEAVMRERPDLAQLYAQYTDTRNQGGA